MGKIIFMGTPDFAVESLKRLVENNIEVAGVITSPDRPAGRGLKIRKSAVKEYAESQNLRILQPEKLKAPAFIDELKEINADLFVVVAFRMLPEMVWDMPPKGTINLHGSLLPQYRGAAPINWAVINGETYTGATTFFIEKEIDTGKIIDSVQIPIGKNDTAGIIHDEMMVKGADLLLETVNKIMEGNVESTAQNQLIDESEIKHAPKIFKPDCQIDWKQSTEAIHNKIRGLSPYPTAWTVLQDQEGKKKSMKLFQTEAQPSRNDHSGKIKVEDQKLYFGATDGWVKINELQLEGKKRMSADQFLLGFDFSSYQLISD